VNVCAGASAANTSTRANAIGKPRCKELVMSSPPEQRPF
jgi:hypothetical protein